jgi:aerobic-type carbon monoxide dehydrogenase small subunit (CoxS/CutS family)
VERLVTLTVNGRARRVDVMKQETLPQTLRYKLGLTGTKIGCDRSECGACTVLVDDVPHYSCSILTHTVRGKSITTIEGLASADGKLSPVQQGVVDEQGFQCAFCMPGFVMAATGYLKLTAIRIPATWAGARFYFEKVRDRNVWDFPLVNVASAMRFSGQTIESARIAVGAVAARPLRLTAVETAIGGKPRSEETAAMAGDLAIDGATPLRYSGYKIPLMRNLVKRAICGTGTQATT